MNINKNLTVGGGYFTHYNVDTLHLIKKFLIILIFSLITCFIIFGNIVKVKALHVYRPRKIEGDSKIVPVLIDHDYGDLVVCVDPSLSTCWNYDGVISSNRCDPDNSIATCDIKNDFYVQGNYHVVWTEEDKYKIGAALNKLNTSSKSNDEIVAAYFAINKYLFRRFQNNYYRIASFAEDKCIACINDNKNSNFPYRNTLIKDYLDLIEKTKNLGSQKLTFTKNGNYWESNKIAYEGNKSNLSVNYGDIKGSSGSYYIRIYDDDVRKGTKITLTIKNVPYANRYNCGSDDGEYWQDIQPVAKLSPQKITISGKIGDTPSTGGGKTIIRKIDSTTKQMITTDSVKFEMYSDSSCRRYTKTGNGTGLYGTYNCGTKEEPNKKCPDYEPEEHWKDNYIKTIEFTGETTLNITEPVYLLEVKAPRGFRQPKISYNKQKVCIFSSCWTYKYDSGWRYNYENQPKSGCIEITPGQLNEIENPTDCITMFNSLRNMDERIWAYRYFKYFISSSTTYDKFLDLDITDPDEACEAYDYTATQNTSCLSGSYDEQTFNERNISRYNLLLPTTTGDVAYCQLSFNLANRLGTSEWHVSSGKMPIQYANQTIAATGTLSQKCYLYSLHSGLDQKYKPNDFPVNRGEVSKFNYFNEIKNIKLDSRELGTSSPSVVKNFNNSSWSEYAESVNYLLKPIYSEIITGKISYDIPKNNGNNYKLLGYGVISKFDATSQYNIPYSITFGSNLSSILRGTTKTSNNCKVYPEQTIITTSNKTSDDLKLSFRIIDTSNPFPGKSGNVRRVGTNWRATSVLNNEYFNYNDYTRWLNLSWNGIKGKILANNTNKNVINDDYGFNSLVEYVMETTNNSYNKNKTKPIYTITLTPTNIKKIREYNKTHKYDDFTLDCKSNATNCTISQDFVNKVVGNQNFKKS